MRLRYLIAFCLLASVSLARADGEGCFQLGAGACVRVPIMNGAFPPATCTVGEIFLDTDQTVDTNCTTTADNSLCLCTATNTWTALENN